MEIQTLWNEFQSTISGFPKLLADLNPGCSKSEITEVEKTIGVNLPVDLKTLYSMNNGQSNINLGIFKAVSGYSKHTKAAFLGLKQVVSIWTNLREKQLDVFHDSLIPFAVSYEQGLLNDVYCVDSNTQEVYLLWVNTADWTLPEDWQTAKFKRGSNFLEFIVGQIYLY